MKKILIVDDEQEFVYVLKERLATSGYDVTVSYNGQEGLAKLQKDKPDVILLDIMMPFMDGFEFIQKMQDEGISVPVIFMTALARELTDEQKKLIGKAPFVTKPFETEDLQKAIKSVVK